MYLLKLLTADSGLSVISTILAVAVGYLIVRKNELADENYRLRKKLEKQTLGNHDAEDHEPIEETTVNGSSGHDRK